MTYESLMNSEKFQEKLYEAKDMAEVRALFAGEGVEMSENQLMSMLLPQGDELKEKDLEDVSGGGSVMTWLRSRLGGGRGAFGGGGSAGGR